MYRLLTILIFCLSSVTGSRAQTVFDSICSQLRDAAVQEKVYLHLDNNCYFKGDTIWYKAYTVRADSLTFTDMSRILHVELVSPDGMLVERQQLIVSEKGFGCGNFVLSDSLYSGYFELRAYTRWMLNFDVTEHPTFWKDRDRFYNRKMMHDFYRQYGTIYSRVVPVYEKPEAEGEYGFKYTVSRPKQRLAKELKEKLQVKFYPEGGHLIAGSRCRVAFEAVDEEGELQEISGTVGDIPFHTSHLGKGVIEVDVPSSGRLQASVSHGGKDYHFPLPTAERAGCSLRLDQSHDQMSAHIEMKGLADKAFLAVVLCRGKLVKHIVFNPDGMGRADLTWNKQSLPTGVNDLIILNEQGIPLADRLFFVNNHDYDAERVTVSADTTEYEPYSLISIDFQAPTDARHLSISVRDQSTDDPSFDTGNILTDLLLSSELRGFVPYPDYYFEADDTTHLSALDLLMMVQGWRRYNIRELLDGSEKRYQPEKELNVEGTVYPTIYFDTRDYSAENSWADEFYNYEAIDPAESANSGNDSGKSTDTTQQSGNAESRYADGKITNNENKGVKKEVTLESELIIGTKVYSIEVTTKDGGNFAFTVPPFLGKGILTMAAYPLDIKEKKLLKMKTKGRLDEDEFPNFYVKRHLFYPVFAKKYSYYQCHLPQTADEADSGDADTEVEGKLSVMDKTLQGVEVKGKKRRGLQTIDYTRPLCSYDAIDLYNLVTDYGLSYGKFNPFNFAVQISTLLLGNLNTSNTPDIRSKFNYYITYIEGLHQHKTEEEKNQLELLKIQGRDNFQGFREPIKLKRLKTINVFSDFELRNEDRPMVHAQDASIYNDMGDVTIDYVTYLDDAVRPTFRDRWIVFPGIYEPDEFYHPDYTHRKPSEEVKDYRRTLYWNPNATLDENGQYHARFYNNGKTTRIKVSVAGLTTRGKPIYNP